MCHVLHDVFLVFCRHPRRRFAVYVYLSENNINSKNREKKLLEIVFRGGSVAVGIGRDDAVDIIIIKRFKANHDNDNIVVIYTEPYRRSRL